MDPNACLARVRTANTDDEHRDACLDLCGWLASGGFEPEWRSRAERESVVSRAPSALRRRIVVPDTPVLR